MEEEDIFRRNGSAIRPPPPPMEDILRLPQGRTQCASRLLQPPPTHGVHAMAYRTGCPLEGRGGEGGGGRGGAT